MIENVEDLHIVMQMYNLLEYSHNYSMTSGSFCNYFSGKIDDVAIANEDSDSKWFAYKIKITRKTPERPPQPGNPGDAD